MKNNKGFVFIETIIVTVVLTTTLIFLYSNFSKKVLSERKRLYYDDISYMYKTLLIRDSLLNSVNEENFKNAINGNNYSYNDDEDKTVNTNSLKYNYVYLFNSESKYCKKYVKKDNNIVCDANDYISIYNDNSYLNNLNELYNFKTLIYLKTSDISNIKKCINNSDDNITSSNKCKNFLNFTSKYSDSNLNEFLLTLNSEDAKSSNESILVALFYERKNGEANINGSIKGGYKSCIYQKYCGDDPNCTIESYYNQDDISYSMACENAYYLSWVYYE